MIDKVLLTTVTGDWLKTLFSGLMKEAGEEFRHVIKNKLLEYQVAEYERNYSAKTLLHRVHPKPLREFYQPLTVREWRRSKESFFGKRERISTTSAKELFSRQQYLTLIGDAGSGKSTIVRYLLLDCIESKFKIPVKVELRYLNDHEGCLIGFIKEKVIKLRKLASGTQVIERLMASGNFVFFLDGFDEVKSTIRQKVAKDIDDLLKLYPKNCFLLTTRPNTGIDLLPMFHNYEVCDLEQEEIELFIRKQFSEAESEFAEKITLAVEYRHDAEYNNFLCNPLLLSMFILSFQSYSSVPQRRSEFYFQVFDTLYSTHDSLSKFGFVREKVSALSKDQFTEILRIFSFISYFEEKLLFSTTYLIGKLNFIKLKKPDLSFENTKLMEDLLIAIGIMKLEGQDIAFPHRAMQEYFAASCIASMNESGKQLVYEKIVDSVTRSRYYNLTENFLILLYELDTRCFIKLVALPLIERIIGILQKVVRESCELNWQAVGALRDITDVSRFLFGPPENEFDDYLSLYRLLVDCMRVGTVGYLRVDESRGLLLNCCKEKLQELNGFLMKENETEIAILEMIDITV